jgi:hypothetical protein
MVLAATARIFGPVKAFLHPKEIFGPKEMLIQIGPHQGEATCVACDRKR